MCQDKDCVSFAKFKFGNEHYCGIHHREKLKTFLNRPDTSNDEAIARELQEKFDKEQLQRLERVNRERREQELQRLKRINRERDRLERLQSLSGREFQPVEPIEKPIIATIKEIDSKTKKENAEKCVGQNCSICQDAIKKGEQCRKLKCNHIYHIDCIDPWLQKNMNCPMCREKV